MITFSRCKINIGLHIIEKRPDNYHNIETVFFPLSFSDGLEITRSNDKFEFSMSGLQLDENKTPNLCVQAYELLRSEFDLPPVKIHLHKKVPPGAGLGGGSSNASNTLLLLNDLFHLELSKEKLSGFARRLGADCPFFIYHKPLIGKDIGDKLVDADLYLAGYHIIVIKPKISINTNSAYKKVIPQKNRPSLEKLISLPVEKWKDHIMNDFENIVFKQHPNIEKIKMTLYKKGALYASMTGSGSALFGIFDHNPVNLDDIFGKYLIWKEIM